MRAAVRLGYALCCVNVSASRTQSCAGVLYGPPGSKVGSSRDKISVGDLVRVEYDG